MSRETSQWLNNFVLIGFTEQRGQAWHWRASDQGDEPNHYPGAVPVEDVRRRLFFWEPLEGTVESSVITENGVERVVDPTRKKIVRPVTDKLGPAKILGEFNVESPVHPYSEWLITHIENILDDDLAIGSAGLLKDGAQAWVQAQMPENINTPEGVSFRPYITGATSLDGTLATTYKTGNEIVVCHATDTPIIDGDWRGLVQDHPSALQSVHRNGMEISVWGLPFPEQVSGEHRYWVRERRTRVGTRMEGIDTPPDWYEAQDIRPAVHEIGTPVDMTEHLVPDRFADEEDAWLIGYWWGNGNVHADNGRITVAVPNHKPELIARVADYAATRARWNGKPVQHQGCVQIHWYDRELADVLRSFKSGEKWSQKTPPEWMEYAPIQWQRALVRGYYDADGNTDTTKGCILVSVSLDGLLSLRRILMRLGVPSSIRKGSDPELRSTIQGRKVNAQEQYSIRFVTNIKQFGYESEFIRMLHPYIQDGVMWSRVKSIGEWEGEVWPITTKTHDYLTAFGLSHNCDNSMHAALRDGAFRVKIRHTKYSKLKVQGVRDALGVLHQEAEAFAAEIAELCGTPVSDKQFMGFMDAWTPLPEPKRTKGGGPGNGYTMATNKRDKLEDLYYNDPRVSPWNRTAFGVLQMVNTFENHESIMRGSVSRVERNIARDLNEQIDRDDIKVLSTLAKILDN